MGQWKCVVIGGMGGAFGVSKVLGWREDQIADLDALRAAGLQSRPGSWPS